MQKTNFLPRSLSGTRTPIQRLSPYLLGLRGINNAYFLPKGRDLPNDGLSLRAETFDFGFNLPNIPLAAFEERSVNFPIQKNFLVWGVCVTALLQPQDVNVTVVPAILISITQQHGSKLLEFFNKEIADLNAGGTAAKPYLLKEPQLVLSGDQLEVDVMNTQNSNVSAQVVLWGGEFEN